MDVSGIGSLTSALSQPANGDAVSLAVLKKALQIEQQAAQQLIASLPQAGTGNPPHLGQSIDVKA